MGAKKKISAAAPTAVLAASPRVALIEDVRAILQQARRKAYAASNFIMVEAYWRIGQRIVQEEQGGKGRAEYGSHLIRNLARQLGEEFGSGVSVASLKNFRQFYLTFPDNEKSYTLRSQLTWSHWRLVMRVQDPAAREYYILQDKGKVTALEAKLKAEGEYEVYRKRQDAEYISDFDREVKRLEGKKP
jgi:hypothetical protein